MKDAVAIIGMGCRFPESPDLPSFWSTIRDGRTTGRDIPPERWRHESFFDSNPRRFDKTYASKLAMVDDVYDFDPEYFGILPRRARMMDPQQRLLLDVARAAFEDAGYARDFPIRNTGVYVGMSVSEHHHYAGIRLGLAQIRDGHIGRVPEGLDKIWPYLQEAVPPIQAYTMVGQMLNMAAANVCHAFDLQGPSFASDAACSSALVALGEAVMHLRSRRCDAAVVGGAYLALKPDNLVAFSRIGALSPTDACRPFEERADGFVLGEGAGALLLKRLDDAVRDGDRVWAVIRGFGITSDGRAEGPMTPRQDGQVRALRQAYDDAELAPNEVDLFEAHGTGTRVGDATEAASLCEIFSERGGGPEGSWLTAVKGSIGHTLAAAGVAGVIKATLAMANEIVPPMPGFETPRGELELEESGLQIATGAQPWARRKGGAPRRAAVSAFGFGGTNVHAILEEPPAPSAPRVRSAGAAAAFAVDSRPVAREKDAELFLLSAPTAELRARHAEALGRALDQGMRAPLADIARTLATRPLRPARAAFVASTEEELLEKLARVARGEQAGGVFLGEVEGEPSPIAFLFPGQGALSIGDGEALARRFPGFRRRLERLAVAADDRLPRGLLTYLHADRASSDAERELTRTEVCQPALAVLSLALADFVSSFGIEPDVLLGHSVGELVAACAGGVLTAEDAVRLMAARGRVMADLDLEDPGAMAAVAADEETVREFLAEGAVVANLNHPRQVVISGRTEAVEATVERLRTEGFKVTPLQVSHAFHSPLMDQASGPLALVFAGFELGAPSRRVISAVRPGCYPEDARAILDLWVGHATGPVRFDRAASEAWKAGARVLVQVGGGSSLLSMARATLRGEGAAPLEAVPLLSGREDGGDLLEALGRLACAGVAVDLEPLFEGRGTRLASLPPAPLETRPLSLIRRPKRPEPMPSYVEAGSGREGGARAGSPAVAALGQKLDGLAKELHSMRGELAALTGEAPPAPMAVVEPAESRTPEVPTGTGTDTGTEAGVQVEQVVLEAISRVTAIPVERLGSGTRLIADLGFDSLMAVELTAALAEALPAMGDLPPDLLADDPPIGELARRASDLIGGGGAGTTVSGLGAATRGDKTAEPAAAEPARTHAVRWVTRPLTPAPAGAELPFAGDVLLIAGGGALAEELTRELEGLGRRVIAGEAHGNGSAAEGVGLVVDLAGMNDNAGHDAIRDGAIRSFAAARRAAQLGAGYVACGRGPAAAAVPGLALSLAREWPARAVKAIELDGELSPVEGARRIAAEITTTDREVEIRYRGQSRLVPTLAPLEASEESGALRPGAVVCVTGGARGLGAGLSLELARRFGARLAILGRRQPNADIERLSAEIERLGGRALYLPCDVTDERAVAAALARARDELGPIEAAFHLAGVTEDGPVERKTEGEFLRVFDVKVGGALALWRAVAGDPIERFAVYGSWAGRFGNPFQSDYGAANRAASWLVESLSAERPEVRFLALELPPWEGGGMVERMPAAARDRLRAAGVPFLTDEIGLPLVIAELCAGAKERRPASVVVGGELPAGRREDRASFHLDPAHPMLDDHRLGGEPVLPMAAALDAVVCAAGRVGVAPAPGGALCVRDLELRGGVTLRSGAGTLVVTARADERGEPPQVGEAEVVLEHIEAATGRRRLAYTARVGTEEGPREALAAPAGAEPPALSLDTFYEERTFHGPRMRALTAVTAVSGEGVTGKVRTSSNGEMPRGGVDVLALDGALQLCALWASEEKGQGAAPLRFEECRVLAPIPPAAELLCVGLLDGEADGGLEGHLDLFTADGKALAQLRGVRAALRPIARAGAERDEPLAPAPDVPTDSYLIEEFPEVKELRGRMQLTELAGVRNPYFDVHEEVSRETSVIDGAELVNFASYNYLGLSGDADVNRAVIEAVERFGTSVSASRLASGERPFHRELEAEIAGFLGCEDAVVFVGGHATNVSVIGQVVGPSDIVVHDSLAHDSILGGARLSGARRRPFRHNDPDSLEEVLGQVRQSARRVLIAVEGVYSMDGDVAPLDRIIELKKRYGALLFVDEAHSLGVLGRTGRGIGEHFDVRRGDVDLWMGTLSKALSSCGGYIAGSRALVELLKYTTGGFVYSVGISPANAAAAVASLRKLQAEPERVVQLQERSRQLIKLFSERGIDTGMAEGAGVVPCIVPSSRDCILLAEALRGRGINVQPILYPAVEEDLVRLRFFVTASHSEEQLVRTADAVREELLKIEPKHLREPGKKLPASTGAQRRAS